MDKIAYREMLEKIQKSTKDIRMHGLWFLFGESVELKTIPENQARDEAMFDLLMIRDSGAACLFRRLADYSPNAKQYQFHYSISRPAHADQVNPLRKQEVWEFEESEFDFLLTEEAGRITKIVFWKKNNSYN